MNDRRAFFDTNVLIYAFATDDSRTATAEQLLVSGGRTSVQVLNEFVAVASRKMAMPWREILAALGVLESLLPRPEPVTVVTHKTALEIAGRYGYHIYDSTVVAAALASRCDTLYSEDMHDGQVIGGLTICNPFRKIGKKRS